MFFFRSLMILIEIGCSVFTFEGSGQIIYQYVVGEEDELV